MTELSTDVKQQELLSFCQTSAWQPQAEGTEEAQASAVCTVGTFELLARSYQNLGGRALKIVFYRQDDDDRKRYVGAIGYHPGSAPYANSPGSIYSEAAFYEILASAGVQ